MKNVLLVFNPRAGSFSAEKLHSIACSARDHGVAVIERPTVAVAAGFTVDFPREKTDAVWVLGGDGTLNAVVAAMLDAGWQDVPVLFLPGGTANVLGHEFGLIVSARRLSPVETMRSGHLRTLDVGLVRHHSSSGDPLNRIFLMSFGTGLDSVVSGRVHPGIKAWFGRLAYILSLLETMLALHALPLLNVTLPDGTRREGRWLLVANASRYADNIRITGGSPADGVMECFLFRLDSAVAFLKTVLSLWRRRPDPAACFPLHRGGTLVVEGGADLQVDGDYAPSDGRVEISFHEAAVRVFILD